MPATGLEIQGRTITLPVRVRRASAWSALYAVRRERTRRLVPDRLEIAGATHTVVSLAFVRYEDSDLDAYNEFGLAIAVRPHDAAPAGGAARLMEALSGKACTYIRALPVDRPFTLEAGRRIWGYPKWLAQIEITGDGRTTRCTVSEDGRRVLSLGIRNGGPLRLRPRPVPTYSDATGTLYRTTWVMGGSIRARPGGAELRLGEGRLADELRALGLPKRALAGTSIASMRAEFGPPDAVE